MYISNVILIEVEYPEPSFSQKGFSTLIFGHFRTKAILVRLQNKPDKNAHKKTCSGNSTLNQSHFAILINRGSLGSGLDF